MSIDPRVAAALVAVAVGLGGAGLAPRADAAKAATDGFSTVSLQDAAARKALDAGLAELRGPAWLAAPKLALVSLAEAERAGDRYRVTAIVKDGSRQRPMRLETAPDGHGGARLVRAVIGPVGDEVLNADVPPPANRPGGWTAQQPGDRETAEAGAEAARLLSGPDWLNRPVRWRALTDARTQVVSGTNTYLAGQAHLDGQTRPVALVLYQPISGASSLSWVSLGEAR